MFSVYKSALLFVARGSGWQGRGSVLEYRELGGQAPFQNCLQLENYLGMSTIYFNDSPGSEPNKPKDLPKTSLPPLALPHWVPVLEHRLVSRCEACLNAQLLNTFRVKSWCGSSQHPILPIPTNSSKQRHMIHYCSLTSQEPSGQQKKKQETFALVQTTVPQSMGLQDAGYFEHGERTGKASEAGPLSAYLISPAPFPSTAGHQNQYSSSLKQVIEIIVTTHKREPENLAFF